MSCAIREKAAIKLEDMRVELYEPVFVAFEIYNRSRKHLQSQRAQEMKENDFGEIREFGRREFILCVRRENENVCVV